MKKIFDFIEETAFGIFVTIGLVSFCILVIILEIKVACSDLYDLEKSCYEFYKENNYILDECNKYSDKLRGN